MAETTQVEPKPIAKSGTPVAVKINYQPSTDDVFDGANNNNGGQQQQQSTQQADDNKKVLDGAGANTDEGKKTDPPTNGDLTEDQLKAYFEKQGIPFESMDSLKAKINAPAPAKELTPEEKEKIDQQKRQRIVNEHLSRKGTVEQLATFEKIISLDKKVLGMEKEVSDLVAEGITKERAEQWAKDRYSQYTDEEINGIEDADEKADAIKLREIGLKKLERKGAYLQKTAKDYLDILAKDLDDKDADAKLMEQHTSKVEDAITKYERKLKLTLGQLNDGEEIPAIDFEVSDAALTSARTVLSNRSEFEKQLLTKDGHVNLDFILPHLVKSFSMDEAIKKSYLEAQDRTTKFFKSKFGTDIPNLGGQHSQGKKETGKVASYGKPKVGMPFANKT